MPHHYDKGLGRLVVQAAEQPSPSHRTYVVPTRGMNTMVEEKYLNPEEGYAPEIRNFLSTLRGTLQKRRGFKRPATPLSGTAGTKYPVEFFEFGDFKGNNHLVYMTENRELRRLEMSSATAVDEKSFADAEDVGGTGEVNNAFFGVVGGTGKTFLFYTGDSFNIPLVKTQVVPDGDDETNAMEHEGFTKLNALSLLAYKDRLILVNTEEQRTGSDTSEKLPYRFRWSNSGKPENYKDDAESTGGYIDLLEDEQKGPILTCLPFRGILAVYKPNSIYSLALRSDGNFIAEMKISDKGLIAPKAVAPVRNGALHFVVSHDNIYLYDGFNLKYPPVGDKIRRYFYDRLDWDKIDSIYCRSFPTRNECWVFFTASAAHGGRREAICWNWERNSWTAHDLPMRSTWWTTQLTYGDAKTRDPIFFGGSVKPDHTGIVELFGKESYTDLGTSADDKKIKGTIKFPLMAQLAGSQADRKQIQHLLTGRIYLEGSIPNANNLNNYTITLRQSDNPLWEIAQGEVLKPAPRISPDSGIPWRESERIQFNVGDWNPKDFSTKGNEEVTPVFYTGIVLEADSTEASEEVSVIEIEKISEGSQFTP